MEALQAVIYRGPWSEVRDDDGHRLRRGERTAVCAKTYRLLTSAPYTAQVIGVEPRESVPEDARQPFDCGRPAQRHPSETRGGNFDTGPVQDREPGVCC